MGYTQILYDEVKNQNLTYNVFIAFGALATLAWAYAFHRSSFTRVALCYEAGLIPTCIFYLHIRSGRPWSKRMGVFTTLIHLTLLPVFPIVGFLVLRNIVFGVLFVVFEQLSYLLILRFNTRVSAIPQILSTAIAQAMIPFGGFTLGDTILASHAIWFMYGLILTAGKLQDRTSRLLYVERERSESIPCSSIILQ